MEKPDLMRELSEARGCVEQDLALGRWRRARLRAAPALHALMAALRKPEPEIAAWLRILAALAAVDRADRGAGQLSLWPDLGPGNPTRLAARVGIPAPGGIAAAALGVVTQDGRMLGALRYLEQLSPTELPILLEGESGTGKEVVARAVHAMSSRSRGRWVAVNCGAMPPQLQESELFGHARGAFTGAALDKPGLFEAADGGTLFLDEVGEMDARAQVKLLRVLESGELRRLGEVRTRTVDVRIVAATNLDVDEAVRAGRFRKDLLFRLGAVRAWLPPLRMRRGDILPLAHYFAHRASPQSPPMTPGARSALLAHDWPGNVRELKFAVERSLALWRSCGAPQITTEMLFPGAQRDAVAARNPSELTPDDRRSGGPAALPGEVALPAGCRLDDYLVEIERRLIEWALLQARGNRTHAARLLGGLSRTTLIGKMKRLGLDGMLYCPVAGEGGAG